MPRYALLRHECPPDYEKPSHWDFMVEQNGVLLTWEVRELPKLWGEALAVATSDAAAVPVFLLADHRLAYLDYEGPISDGRGNVTRCDHGNYQLVDQGRTLLEVRLSDGKLCGLVKLTCADDAWQLTVSAATETV
ncbi:MAG: hypothetical protein GXP26_07675 [Planctomycetes bacterium]|nr:hypothetical protein [Planctomycetota bacterium]